MYVVYNKPLVQIIVQQSFTVIDAFKKAFMQKPNNSAIATVPKAVTEAVTKEHSF